MKEAFEMILKRLEEHFNSTDNRDMRLAYHHSMKIVHEVAEEYTLTNGWIPIKTRPMTEEEKEYYSEFLDEDNGMIYECPLPDDEQEVLITTKYGHVEKTTFYQDGCYFENYEDYDEVIAWKPLPNLYKENENL